MKIAYILLCHKNTDQILRLITSLNSDSVSFFLHFDANSSDAEYKYISKKLEGVDVFFVPRVKCNWGGFGIVDRMLYSLKIIAAKSNPFDFVFYVSGQCYPIKSQKLLFDYLNMNRKFSFIRCFPLPCDKWPPDGGMNRLNNWYFWLKGERYVFPSDLLKSKYLSFLSRFEFIRNYKKNFPFDFNFYGGSSFWVLHSEAADYVVRFCHDNPQYVRFFERTFIPDEMFFQTLLMNSPLRERIVTQSLHYISWPEQPSPHPDILTTRHFDQMQRSERFFARKFDMSVDAEIFDLIDSNLLTI